MTVLTSIRSIRLLVGRVAILLVAAAAGLAAAKEPDFVATHAQAVAENPEGVSCAIGLVARQPQFRVGELIPLDLVYAFDEADEYLINDDLWRGSGAARLLEVFRVSPQEGTHRRTLNEPESSRTAGGTPREAKGDRIYRYRVYLNEWRRFDRPGKYRFYCTGARVWTPGDYRSNKNNTLRVTSNLLELEILPATNQWQSEQLRAAVEVLDRSDDVTDKRAALCREALRRLRYLGTEAATRQLARCYPGRNEGEKYEIEVALSRSGYKAAAVEEIRRPLDAPDFVVTAPFLIRLARLAADAIHPIDYDAFRGDKDAREKLSRVKKEHRVLEERLSVEYFQAAWAAVETKKPVVRARSLLELFRFANYYHMRDLTLLTPERLARTRAAIISVFEELPPRDQELLLKWNWNRLGGADFLPALRRFVAVAPPFEEGDDWPSPLDLTFRRIFQLAPEEGRTLILAELRRARPRATLDSLTLLPDQPIPELDDSLATRLEQGFRNYEDPEMAATLVARYGSAAIYDRVQKLCGNVSGGPACDVQASMLAYFVRHRPEEGGQLVEQALDAQGQTGRYCSVLCDVARGHMTAKLERIAVERLDDENLEIAGDAARLLQRYGSAAAERVLWQKLERWHAAWKDRVGELTVTDSRPQANPQVRFEMALVDALVYGKSWFTGPTKLGRLRALCLAETNRKIIDGRLYEWREPVTIHFQAGGDSEFPSARPSYQRGTPAYDCWHVAQYSAHSLCELKKLLARFPAGTTFTFPIGMLTDTGAEERLFADLQREVASYGLKLIKAPHRD